MYDMLVHDYGINLVHNHEDKSLSEFTDGGYNYFTIVLRDREGLHMEEIVISHFLETNGCEQIAAPIRNIYGEWFTLYDEERHLVLRHKRKGSKESISHGKELAKFHKLYRHYPYEPRFLSSYGEWKDLWIDKLDYFEQKFINHARTSTNEYCAKLIELFPYMVGLSENAIQYMTETAREKRFGQTDRPAIVFRRYTGQLEEGFMLPTELQYDHPVRDIAEWIRLKFFYEEQLDEDEIRSFLQEYEKVEPISIFGWRLIYARLLFPAHFFDLLESGFERTDEKTALQELARFSSKQEEYQRRLGSFFDIVNVDPERYQVAIVNWL